ncbi:SDR family oxidoreductase [Solirubrobacter ginsenosidimutans]|uniref:SDR family oxidoreductase n=1 Tax=Solirubrobacter ginsenosidimutans TaxID=490573 RepID=A0A9X3N0R0_9ACTN|nr:SDR family oxidoreductase [Solirubrobacter ginsenosidimutans]MDA0166092.1 SDR family oxidoreductase [Solirubrobacter ginsenosidimutans]
MLLKGKNAVVYGGAGSIGGAAARAFAREGAHVFLAGRTPAPLQALAKEIGAEWAVVDALDAAAVDAHADTIGRIDISFNVINHNDVQGTPMAEMDVEDYLAPVLTAVRTNLITWQAAARHGAGVILVFGGEGDPPRGYHLGGLQTAFHALEAMRRQFSTENRGVRVITLRTGGVPESIPKNFQGRDAITKSLDESTLLGRSATLEDVGNVAAFVASDQARTMTAATVNVSAGALID